MKIFTILAACLALGACKSGKNIPRDLGKGLPPPEPSPVLQNLQQLARTDPGLPAPVLYVKPSAPASPLVARTDLGLKSDPVVRTAPPPAPEKDPAGLPSAPLAQPSREIPVGVPVAGASGFIYSPYRSGSAIDVAGIPKGTLVFCPWTNGPVLVP